MFCYDKLLRKGGVWALAATLLLSVSLAHAQGGFIAGLNVELDSADGRAAGGFLDYGFTDSTWLSIGLARTNTGGPLGGLETLYADTALEQSFGAFGIRAAAAYWGDDEILDSNDGRISAFYRGERASISIDYERRSFDFVIEPLLTDRPDRTVEFTADGIGGVGRLRTGDKTSLFASGMAYDYSRDIRLTDNIDTLRFLSSSRLSLMNSLVDYRFNVGFDYSIGQHTVDLSFSQWQTAIDGSRVNSIAIGLLTPAGYNSDFDLRLAFDESETFGSTVALAIGLYFFGA